MTVARFAIIESGRVANVIEAPSDWPEGIRVDGMSPEPSIGWAYDGTVFTAPPAAPPPTPVVQTTPRMSHFGFLSRMTPAARLAIRQRTERGSPDYDPILDDAMFLFHNAEQIDVSLELTQQLVGYMAQIGLVTSADVPALLAPIDINSPHAKP